MSADQSVDDGHSTMIEQSMSTGGAASRMSPARVLEIRGEDRVDRTADSIVGTLLGLFPDSSPPALRELVNEQLSRFAGAKVTTFIPVLVLRACREALTSVSTQRVPSTRLAPV